MNRLPIPRVIAVGVALVMGFAVACTGGSSTDDSSEPLATAEPSIGVVDGVVTDDGVAAFLGVPFAKAPVGDLRFKPPQPVEPWEVPRSADEFGPACVQSAEPGSIYDAQSEDCLTLNVWTPSADDAQRPVMVWIHGGGWVGEGTSDVLYDGGRLAARGDVVVVSMEYRLGIFGFSYLDGLDGGDEFAGSGNLGLIDQQLALRWVQEHIAAFGGDPDRVTVFGESAGSMSVVAHLAMPSSEGLFGQAIAQSGAGNTVRSSAYAAAVARRHLDTAGVATPQEFAALSTEEILATQQELEDSEFLIDVVYGPVHDGRVLPEFPHLAIAAGAGRDIPLLAGTTRDETSLYNLYIPGLAEIDPEAVVEVFPYLQRALPSDRSAGDVIDFYEQSRSDQPERSVFHAVGTDLFFRMPTIRLVESRLVGGATETYLYRFDWIPPAPGHPDIEFGSPHGAELAFVFDHPDGWTDMYGEEIPRPLVDEVMDSWIAFARTGDPNTNGVPRWPSYDLDTRTTLLLDATNNDATSGAVDDPDGREREFWVDIPFDGITPAQQPDDL